MNILKNFIMTNSEVYGVNEINNVAFNESFNLYKDFLNTYLNMVNYQVSGKFINPRMDWLQIDTINKTFEITFKNGKFNQETLDKLIAFYDNNTCSKTVSNKKDNCSITYNNYSDYIKENKGLLLKKIALFEDICFRSDLNNCSDSTSSTKLESKEVKPTDKVHELSVNLDKEMMAISKMISKPASFNTKLINDSMSNEAQNLRKIKVGYEAVEDINDLKLGFYGFYDECIPFDTDVQLLMPIINDVPASIQKLNTDLSRLLMLIHHERIALTDSEHKNHFKKGITPSFVIDIRKAAELLGYPEPTKKARERILQSISLLSQVVVTAKINDEKDGLRKILNVSEKTTSVSSPIIKIEMFESSDKVKEGVIFNDRDMLTEKVKSDNVSASIQDKIVTRVHVSLGLVYEALMYKKWSSNCYIVPHALASKSKQQDMVRDLGLYIGSQLKVNYDKEVESFNISLIRFIEHLEKTEYFTECQSKVFSTRLSRFCDSVREALSEYVNTNRISPDTLENFDIYRKTLTKNNFLDKKNGFTIVFSNPKKTKNIKKTKKKQK